jgi:predicted PurR-regulated permease PerM
MEQRQDRNILAWKKKVYQTVFVSLLLAIFYFLVQIGHSIKEILVTFAIAILINYLLAKPVSFLTKYIRIRALSILIIFLLFVSSFSLLVFYLLPKVIDQLKALKTAAPDLAHSIETASYAINNFLANYSIELPIHINKTELTESLVRYITKINLYDFSFVAPLVVSSVSIILYMVLTLILSFYFLLDGDRVWELFLMPFSKRFTLHLRAIKRKVDSSLYAYIVGQFQIASLTALVMLVTYIALQIPYALILALVQMLEIIPLIGTWAAIVPCILIVGATKGWSSALIAFIVYIIYSQFIRDNFIAPKIMGTALGFHPVGIILGLIIGAKLGGAVGVVLVLPLLAVIFAIVDYFVELSRLKVYD